MENTLYVGPRGGRGVLGYGHVERKRSMSNIKGGEPPLFKNMGRSTTN